MINDKCEAAFVALLTAAIAELGEEVGVHPAKDSEDKTSPLVICDAQGEGEEEPKYTGNYWLDVSIIVKHAGVPDEDGTETEADPKTLDLALLEAVKAVVSADELEAQLSGAVEAFTVFERSIIRGSPIRGRDEQGVWIDTFPIRLYCCDSALG